MIIRIFSYLDKFYLKKKAKLGELALNYFVNQIFQESKQLVTNNLFDEITKDRD